MWPNPYFPTDLVTFTGEVLSEKLHFLCSGNSCRGKHMELYHFNIFTLINFMLLVSYRPLKTSENQRFFDVFSGYRTRPVAWNGLNCWKREYTDSYPYITGVHISPLPFRKQNILTREIPLFCIFRRNQTAVLRKKS